MMKRDYGEGDAGKEESIFKDQNMQDEHDVERNQEIQ